MNKGVGAGWLLDKIESMPDKIVRYSPVQYNEENRYLPSGTSPRPGYIRYDLFPFLIEVLECFDVMSPVREVNMVKGVQTGYTTLLESVLMYAFGHIRTDPLLFISADKELAKVRVDNNILPMINHSGMDDRIRPADEKNHRKTGKTKDYIQWDGGGSMIYTGATNAAKMRMYSMPWLLKDEVDAWKKEVGMDGNPDALTDDRASVYWDIRKILRGSTPLLAPSTIWGAYLKGDQRKYHILCRGCSFPQILRMEHKEVTKNIIGGFHWDTQDGQLVNESVAYRCPNCGRDHYESDKPYLFSLANGAEWKPTAVSKEPNIRSYHLPAFYSPYKFRPWYKNIALYLESYDTEGKKVINPTKLQVFYNNVLGVPFKVIGAEITFEKVSAHRRPEYSMGQVPNELALAYTGSEILLLTCQVDVHVSNLSVAVMGWTKGKRCFLIDYWRIEKVNESDDCSQIESPCWGILDDLISNKVYTADNGKMYKIAMTLVDSSFSNATVVDFCSSYASNVYPIIGRDRPSKNQKIQEFAPFKTQSGTLGYRIIVDHYKDLLSGVLRRSWTVEAGEQKFHHFNAPVDTTDDQLKELTAEVLVKKTDDKGQVTYSWHRPGGGNKRNELWDLLVYGSAAVDIVAWYICINQLEQNTIVWDDFWELCEGSQLFLHHE